MKTRLSFLLLLIQTIAFCQPKEDSINLITTTGIIKGSLFVPAGKPTFSVLIIIAGSGPTDRYGNSPLGVKANSYKMIADALGNENIGVLLYDKRGIAKSMAAAKSEASLSFEDYVADAVRWIGLLKKDKRIKSIFIAGHSEGSLIGMLAAQQTTVQGYISLAGPAKGIAEIIIGQFAQQLPKAAPVVDSLFNRLKNNQPLDTVPQYLQSIFRPSVQPYIKSWMKYIPCNEIKKLTIPTLVIQGGTDIQVSPAEAESLKQCKPDAAILLVDSMNHVLKNAPLSRMENLATYNNSTLPLAAGLTTAIVNFIRKYGQ